MEEPSFLSPSPSPNLWNVRRVFAVFHAVSWEFLLTFQQIGISNWKPSGHFGKLFQEESTLPNIVLNAIIPCNINTAKGKH